MRRFRFWSFLIIPRHREGVAGRTLLGDVMTLQPSQHGWQHPVKSGSEKLQENRELQLSQAFQVRSGSGDGLWVSAWRKEHLSGPEPRFCFCSCDGFIVAPGTGHGFWLYSTRTTEIDVYYYFLILNLLLQGSRIMNWTELCSPEHYGSSQLAHQLVWAFPYQVTWSVLVWRYVGHIGYRDVFLNWFYFRTESSA